MSARRRLVAVVAVLGFSTGCGDGLQFIRDERLQFLRPEPRSVVAAPVEVAWDFRTDGGRRPAAFAVFVDRPVIRPGRHLTSVADDHPLCRPAAGCPDRDWLERNGVFLTRRSSIVLPGLPAHPGRRVRGRRLHEVTVVLLDARGVRIGESAWTVRFFGPRGAP